MLQGGRIADFAFGFGRSRADREADFVSHFDDERHRAAAGITALRAAHKCAEGHAARRTDRV